MKKYHLILICIIFLTILSTSYAEQINGINFTNPETYQDGTISTGGGPGIGVYTKHINDFFFRIFVYSDAEHMDTYVGYKLYTTPNKEKITIDGHPAMLLKYSTGPSNPVNSTEIIFESDGKIVTIEIPYTNELTNASIDIIKSTPPSTLSETEFNLTMNYALNIYKIKQDLEDSYPIYIYR